MRLANKHLEAVISDNGEYGDIHLAGFNGVSDLRLTGKGQESAFYVPFAGLNFEHIFSGDSESFGWNIFEPRQYGMKLVRSSRLQCVLAQTRTQNWPLATRITFTLAQDGLDFKVSATPTEDIWAKHGYIGMFFASYINVPSDKAIYFIGRNRGETKTRWIRSLPRVHSEDANHRPMDSDWDPVFDPGFKPEIEPEKKYWLSLVYGISNLEYAYPFYYGRVGDNVLIFMFEKTNSAEQEIRFAQSPTGGIETCPAWDFILFQKKYAINQSFMIGGRLVYKKFEGIEDVVATYEKWSGEKVVIDSGHDVGAA